MPFIYRCDLLMNQIQYSCLVSCGDWRNLRSTEIRKLAVFTTTAMVCKHGVTSIQERGGWIGVCVGVLITFLQLIPAGQHMQLQNSEHFPHIRLCYLCFHLHIFMTKQIRQLFRIDIQGMRIYILAYGPPNQLSRFVSDARNYFND